MAVKARWLIALLAFAATPLLANQHPGPQMMLAEMLLLPLMMLLTLIGGGYAILRRLNPQRRTLLKVLGVFALVFVSWGTESSTLLVVAAFAIIAVVRAVKMIVWSIRARATPSPEYLRDAQPLRLIGAGVVLIPIAIFLATTTVAFVGAVPRSDADRIVALRKYVALRLALRTAPSPQRAELEKNAAVYSAELQDVIAGFGDRHDEIDKRGQHIAVYELHVRIDERGDHFVVYMKPNVLNTPFPPYDRFLSVPTYRADETGLIRMKLVHSRDALCPPDAPIVGRVGDDEIRAVLAGKMF